MTAEINMHLKKAAQLLLEKHIREEKAKPKPPPAIRLHEDEKAGVSYFKCGNMILSGACGLTEKWYWPNWDFKAAQKEKPPKEAEEDDDEVDYKKKGKPKKVTTPAPPKMSAAKAKKIGMEVDEQLKHWVRYKSITDLDKPHAYTQQIVAFFGIQKWTPVASQKIVGIPSCRVASAIDLLVRDEKNRLTLVEVKTTANDSYFEKSGGQTLSAPFGKVPSSALSHAFLEAGFQKICYEYMHPKEKIERVVVVRAVGSTGDVVAYQPESWFDEALLDMKVRIKARGAEKLESSSVKRRRWATPPRPPPTAAAAATTTTASKPKITKKQKTVSP